ncbi:putative UDP-glycosyltransferase 74F2-like [Capsicum annuum]|nr:putative UDP-glycosyltransferase 74F2-like [Capsicum annuum]
MSNEPLSELAILASGPFLKAIGMGIMAKELNSQCVIELFEGVEFEARNGRSEGFTAPWASCPRVKENTVDPMEARKGNLVIYSALIHILLMGTTIEDNTRELNLGIIELIPPILFLGPVEDLRVLIDSTSIPVSGDSSSYLGEKPNKDKFSYLCTYCTDVISFDLFLHSGKRARGSGGRFLNTKNMLQSKLSSPKHDGNIFNRQADVTSISNGDDMFQQPEFRVSGFPFHMGATMQEAEDFMHVGT